MGGKNYKFPVLCYDEAVSMTANQKRFCELYLQNGNNGQNAYSEAYNQKNLEVCRTQASILLNTNPNIKGFLQGERQAATLKYDLSKDKLIAKLFKPVKLYEKMLKTMKVKNQTPEQKAFVAEVKSFISTAEYKALIREIALMKGDYAPTESKVSNTFEVIVPQMPSLMSVELPIRIEPMP